MKIEISSRVYLFLILVLSILVVWPLFLPGYFFHHDDLQVMRVLEMKKCFEDFQIPCRWVPDMGYGNGYPLFNYYSALPYYVGGILSFLLGLVNAAKALFFIPLVLGGISMYLLAQKLFNKEAGFLSGILYLFAPYRALDSYVRGAVAESFAIAIIPLVFYFSLKNIEKPSRLTVVLGSLSLGSFLLSHNIMTMLFIPILILWNLLILYFQKWKNWKAVLSSFLLGTGLAAFFLLSVFFEKNLVQSETLLEGGSNFRTHFVTVGQLFMDRSWGYGGSEFGPNDTISFQIGWPLWWFVITAIVILLIKFKRDLRSGAGVLFFQGVFLFSIFMTHNKSAFIWEMIGPLQFSQFPWRFLSLSIFAAAILAGYCIKFFSNKIREVTVLLFAAVTIFLNWNYFMPRDFYPWINDTNKLEDPLWEIQQKAGILDYLPKTAYEPQGRAPSNIEVLAGKAEGSNYNVRSNKFSFDVKVSEDSYIQVPVFDFPNWTVYVNGEQINHDNKSSLGRIGFELSPGTYQVYGVFKNTLVRTVGNLLTVTALILLLLISLNKRIFKLLT